MYSVSENYITAVRANTRTDRLLTTLTLPNSQVLHLTDADYGQNSIKINWQCVDSEELMFGAAYTTPMDISIRTNLSRYQFYGAVLEPVYEVKIGPNSWYPIPLGVFTVSEATRVGQLVQMTAYDNMQKFDMEWNSRIVTGTPYVIVKFLCDEAGVDMATQETDMENWPNYDLAIQLDETNGCSTLRDGIKYICQLVGAFARINRTGALELVRFHTTSDLTLTDSDRYSSSIADYSCSYVGLSVTGMAGTYTSYASGQIDNGLLMVMSDAAAWDTGAPRSLQTRTDRLFAYLQTIEYVPADVTMPGDPSIECGDMITLEVRGDTLNTIVTSVSWAYRGQMSFGSVGQNPYFAGTTSSAISSNRILSLQGEQNKTVLYSYKNAEAVSVGSTFHDICKFAFATLGSTDCLFYMTIILDVTADGPDYHDVVLDQSFVDDSDQPIALTGEAACEGRVEVDFQYLLQNEAVDYLPTETFTEGRHTYVLFFPIIGLSSLLSYTWRVQMKCTGGTVEIAETNLRATLWGQNLNDREIPWDGILLITEQVQPLSIVVPTMAVTPLTDSTSITQTQPDIETFSELISAISIASANMSIAALSDFPIIGRKTMAIRLNPLNASEYVFSPTYVNVTETAFSLRLDYTFISQTGVIDSGYMSEVEIPLDDFDTVTTLTITSDYVEADNITTEDGDFLTTEGGDYIITEG